ncbi:MAG: prolyl-tRNA synthetase [Parcubacteria group bacterium Greene0714_21]|nr:MAG: prolyl-tRNA synthetase [Parcubacteria group bacterium Greene0416_39]TSC97740.1 MAG: prolyl-tRNA synthetase [Parcubacteria group bacterium Greene1014_47]TSD04337.1 MAG: prolyl-tRNA synthetase [Parcubacteria group bacterium Greene0714_21]
MRQFQLFTKTSRNAPKDEESKNAKLLIQAGFIRKEMAGVYSFLPFGLRVLNKIIGIIREEMNAIGGQELLLTTLQDPEVWKKTGRWVEEEADPQHGLPWFKTKLVNKGELGLANTHEEPLTNLMREHVASYRDLPRYVYQFQTKFRNELRAKSGIMRTREFIMKDLYSFSRNEEEFRAFYEQCAEAYMKIFTRAGIGERTYRTFASGGSFSKFSDEFQTICQAGEDTIYVDKKKNIAVNKEVYNDEILMELGLKKNEMSEERAIEVGNIFPLGTKFSVPLGLTFKTAEGSEKPVIMGSYGIGPARLMGTVVEMLSDEKGIVWPESIAPFSVHLLALEGGEKEAKALYERLEKQGMEVLYDDRTDKSSGEKLVDADLLGIPTRIVVSARTLEQGSVEVKKRNEEKHELVKLDALTL